MRQRKNGRIAARACLMMAITAIVSGLHQSTMTPSNAPVAAHLVLTVFVNALILQRMALTIRSVEFPIPSGLGVHESGYVLFGNFLAISAEPPLLCS
jgi:hypothetical protein